MQQQCERMDATDFIRNLYDLWAREKGIQIEIEIQRKAANGTGTSVNGK